MYSANSYLNQEQNTIDYRKTKIGVKQVDNAVLNLGAMQQSIPNTLRFSKGDIYRALIKKDYDKLRQISNYFYDISGIYREFCNYYAFIYRYDWYLAYENMDANGDAPKEDKIVKDFMRILRYLDNSNIRKICGDIALEVLKNGNYYGYIVPNADRLVLQQLPSKYCRSRYNIKNVPAIEFNMKFFDTFQNPAYKLKVLDMFPDEFKKGYILYKKNKLVSDYPGEFNSWYLLDPNSCIKFNLNNSDIPYFVSTIPSIMDLDQAQDLDRRKQMQKLLKILVQKLPLDKNGELIFDVEEARDIHNNAVEMLKNAIGVDVLTTFADITPIDTSDRNSATTVDDLEKVERTVFNNSGISKNIFNTDGNLALTQSILQDESSMRNLLLQFTAFFNNITQYLNINKKKYNFSLYMLETTQSNYKELSKLYKEQTQNGFSKILPQIALGQSQSFILNSIKFENEVLHLQEIMIPPLMSSTLNGEDVLGGRNKNNDTKTQSNQTGNGGTAGRPEKADDQKSAKTIANKESMS